MIRVGLGGDIVEGSSYLVSEEFGHWVELQALGNNVEPEQMSVHSQSSHGLHLVATLDSR